MKRLNLLLIAILLITGLAIPSFTKPGITLAAPVNVTFVTSNNDGFIQYSGDDYSDGWNAATGDIVDESYHSVVGQSESGGDHWWIYRAFLFFDTSSIPSSATVTSAIIRVYGEADESDANFNIVIQEGVSAVYPHDPLVVGDYDKDHYTGNGGILASTSFNPTGWSEITLNTTGESWINKGVGATTKLCLRSSEDIAGSEPTQQEYVVFYSYEHGASYRPELIVIYEASAIPTITTNDATYITTATARLNSYLDNDGGEACDVRFQYGTDTGNYTVNTTWVNDTYTTGQSPYVNIGSLIHNTTYFFRAQANNDAGIFNGSELNFTTDAIQSYPTNLVAFPSSHSISLSWIKGNGTTNTTIRVQVGSYPTNYTDGTSVYDNSMSTVTHSGLIPGTTYYYRAWGESGGNYTTGNASVMATTSAGGAAGIDPAAPAMPSLWYGAPDHTRLSGVPFYSMVNDMADEYGMPPTNFWLLLFLFGATLMGLFIYAISHSAIGSIMAGGVTLVILLNSLGGLLWIMFAVGIIATGIFMAVRRT